MEIHKALHDKWNQGVQEHRPEGGTFRGAHPLAEIHDELLDVLLYLNVAEKMKSLDEDVSRQLRSSAMDMIRGTRTAAKIIGLILDD